MILKLTEDSRRVYFDGKTYSYKDLIKAIPGSSWDKKGKYWSIPIESVTDAKRILPSLELAPEVFVAFKDIETHNEQAIKAKDIDLNKVVTKVKGLKGELYPYQGKGKLFLDTVRDGEGGIIAFDMGLGKSLTSLATYVEWKRKGIVDYCLVVCPSPLKYSTWAKEIEKWTDLEYIVVDGDKAEMVEWDDGSKQKLKGRELRAVQYAQWQFGADVIVMNYELFLKDMDILPPIDGRWAVVLDECQRIKNPKAKTTKNILKVCKPAGRKIPASGTPLENNVQELWSIVDLCKPGMLGNYYKFEDRYCEKDFFGSVIAPKAELMGELKAKIAPVMFRMTKEEALPNLPPLSIQEYWVSMTKEQKKLYAMVKEGVLANLSTGEFTYLEALAQLTRLQQLVDSPKLLREVLGDEDLPVESGKLTELANIIKDLDPNKTKFILFSQYRQMTDILYQWLIDKKLLAKEQIGYIRGGMKASETARIQKEYQEGNIQCVLMTTAGNYGLDLSAGSYVICYDCLFNPQKMQQIYARAHRNGVKQAVTAINLVTKDSYEEKKVKILEGKKELFHAMMDKDDEAFVKLFTKQELIDMV
jgi:SNF2 family DNA or RNA helicase